MTALQDNRILGRRDPAVFIGRSGTIESLIAHANGTGSSGGRLLLHAPRTGATELLLQTYDRIFSGQTDVFPVYFCFDGRDTGIEAAGKRFLREFLTQFAAFRRRDPRIIFMSPSIAELAKLVPPADSQAFDEIVSDLLGGTSEFDASELRSRLFSAPVRAAFRGLRPFVIFDSVDATAFMDGGTTFVADLVSSYSRAGFPYLLAARRRFGSGTDGLGRIVLETLRGSDLEKMIEATAKSIPVDISDATRDLMALHCGGDLAAVHSLLSHAAESGRSLDDYRGFARIYTDVYFGGAIAEVFDRELEAATGSADVERQLVSLLNDLANDAARQVSIETWEKRLGVSGSELQRLIEHLDIAEFVRTTSNRIESMSGNRLLTDYIHARFRLEVKAENRTSVYADALTELLDRAPHAMAESYRRHSAVGLREMMEHFDGKTVPITLLDYGRFKYEYKGVSEDEVIEQVRSAKETYVLPQIVFSAPTEAFYKAIGLLTEAERSAVAIGFEDQEPGSERRIAWIAAEVDSKLEAARDTAEFWCDRLEMAAIMCGFNRYRIWLVSPEGFTDEALEVIADRGGFGSSRHQARLLSRYLTSERPKEDLTGSETYEIVIPMTDEAEMVSARTLEEIARRHNIGSRDINQIKTALVEACINAAEHSLSPDQRIHQKFAVSPERIRITVINRGVRLVDRPADGSPAGEGRRGWGLDLMRKLMDEVTIDQVDDGTSITMTKYLQPAVS